MTIRTGALCLSVAIATPPLSAVVEAVQDVPVTVRKLYESGKYREVIEHRSADHEHDPEEVYLAAQAYLKVDDVNAAKDALADLLDGPDDDAWTLIARSERARIDQDLDEALSLARSAAAGAAQSLQDPSSSDPPARLTAAYALYQLGLVQSQRQDMIGAADSFEKASAADPAMAYAHYYAGMAYSRLKRIDRMAVHFETFLKLAPESPERGAVESIMRTVRGR